MPRHRPPPPPSHPHGPHRVFFRNEHERPLSDIAQRLQKIGEALAQRGAVKFGDHEVKPADPSWFMEVYEQPPHGQLSLKLELEWGPDEPPAPGGPPSKDLEIE